MNLNKTELHYAPVNPILWLTSYVTECECESESEYGDMASNLRVRFCCCQAHFFLQTGACLRGRPASRFETQVGTEVRDLWRWLVGSYVIILCPR